MVSVSENKLGKLFGGKRVNGERIGVACRVGSLKATRQPRMKRTDGQMYKL